MAPGEGWGEDLVCNLRFHIDGCRFSFTIHFMNMIRQYRATFIFFLVILLLAGCNMAPGSESTRSKTIQVTAFVDENLNGRYDKSEPPIPDTLIVAQSNIHGTFTRTAALTDAAGVTEISTDYTHIFDLAAVTPCGYEPATAAKLSAADANFRGEIAFGFRPESPSSGDSELQVHLWQDDYEDGVQQDNERPLPDTTIHFNPDLGWGNNSDNYTGLLTAQTDAEGQVSVSLGNGCGLVWMQPITDLHITKVRPSALYEAEQIGFEYGDGLLEVRIGLTNNIEKPEPASVLPNQFTFSSGGANHPEGLGEWQFLLDRGGYFGLKHVVGDEETDYGVITMLPAENEHLWQLISAADLPALPTTMGDAVPDTVAYTFTLTANGEETARTLLSSDAQENEAIMALLASMAEVIKSHTGEDAVLR